MFIDRSIKIHTGRILVYMHNIIRLLLIITKTVDVTINPLYEPPGLEIVDLHGTGCFTNQSTRI